MRSVEFCYWLQGHFELETERGDREKEDGEIIPLTGRQAEIIQNHLALVLETFKTSNPKLETAIHPFIHWLTGVLESRGNLKAKGLDVETTALIREKLSKAFEHIDQLYPGVDLASLLGIHQGQQGTGSLSPTLIRC